MRTVIVLVTLGLAGCANLPTPPPFPTEAINRALTPTPASELGFALLLNSGYSSTPQTTGEILAESILNTQGALPYQPPVVQPLQAPSASQTNCVVYPSSRYSPEKIICRQ